MQISYDWIAPMLPVADVLYAFRESTISGKLIVLLLVLGSVGAWSIMVTKYFELRRAQSSSEEFIKAFRKEEHPIGLFLQRKRYPGSPLYRIYEASCVGLGSEFEVSGGNPGDLFMGKVGSVSARLDRIQLSAVEGLTDRNVADQTLLLESNMGWLATAVSTAPFLGLLGTVWGVMDSFGGMATKGSATLSAVAPGISAALLTTIVGLFVALPSAIGYNMLTNQIRTLAVKMDNFAQEFEAAVRRVYYRE